MFMATFAYTPLCDVLISEQQYLKCIPSRPCINSELEIGPGQRADIQYQHACIQTFPQRVMRDRHKYVLSG